MPQVRELIQQATQAIGSRLEAEMLLAESLGRTRAWIYAHATDHPDQQAVGQFNELLKRRADGEPMAYILGKREFFGREFQVTPAVLIPRPETELLVEIALELALPDQCTAIDVGTGSGCIALSLAAERPQWQISATDISSEALAIASTNQQALGLTNVDLLLGDLLAPIEDRQFNLIVSNPPYVADGDSHLKQGDLRFEPESALASGREGLDIIKRLIRQSRQALRPDGWLLIEHGHDQGPALRKLLADAGLVGIESRLDLAGIERVSLACQPMQSG